MKFLKNKFFIIILSIAVFSVILTATLGAMGVSDPLKNAVNAFSSPFRMIGMKIGEAFEGYKSYFSSVERLKSENTVLLDKIDELEDNLSDANALRDENERLREYLEIKKSYPQLKMVDALIIGKEGENHTTFFTLNRGSIDGVTVGMSVIIKDRPIGAVCEVGDVWCRVRLLSEASSSVGAYVPRSGEIGLIEGDISLKGSGKCFMNYLDADADVKVGDDVLTSGLGSVYPRDLMIGKIVEIKIDSYQRTKIAVIEWSVDVNSLKYVMIVTDNGSLSSPENEIGG